MSKSVSDILPGTPSGSRWSVTVLDSSTGELGVKLISMKPYREWGGGIINEKWTPGKIRKALAPALEMVEGG